jgi:hypothetical protein
MSRLRMSGAKPPQFRGVVFDDLPPLSSVHGAAVCTVLVTVTPSSHPWFPRCPPLETASKV